MTNENDEILKDEIMTVQEVAAMLKMKPAQIYEQVRARTRARKTYPMPHMKLNGNLRFRKSDILKWLDAQARRTTPDYKRQTTKI
jgi:predicted DNA-binding transcriptional regulator AlpA